MRNAKEGSSYCYQHQISQNIIPSEISKRKKNMIYGGGENEIQKEKITPELIALTFIDEPDNNITQISNRPHFVDDEIEKFNDVIDDLNEISQYNWIKTDEKYDNKLLPFFHSVTYRADDYKLMGVECKYNDSPDDAKFIALITPKYFIIIGVVGEHPMIETTYMSYANSDGSGPDIFDKLDNPKKLAQNLIKYYHKFINDEYH